MTLHECKTLEEVDAHIADADFLVIHKENLPGELANEAAAGTASRPRLPGRPDGNRPRDGRSGGSDAAGQLSRGRGTQLGAHPRYLKRMPQHRRFMQERAYVQEAGSSPRSEHHPRLRPDARSPLGMGEIARPMARYAQAFGMKTIYWDIRRFEDIEAQYGVEYVSWEDLWSKSDILSVQFRSSRKRTKSSARGKSG